MTILEYQQEANVTDQLPGLRTDANILDIMVPLLGLAGEAGSLLTEYKKWLLEGASYQIFTERLGEELGDILWYVANIATKEGLSLEAIANDNLQKAKRRWIPPTLGGLSGLVIFDGQFPIGERLPSTFTIEFGEETSSDGSRVTMRMEGQPLGSPLTDNAYENDGYRYHDVFHLAYASVLGWSPVTRSLMGRKRKSDKAVDRVEDGGRAIAIEEGISALVFGYAHDHAFLEGVDHVDYALLRTIKQLTSHLEVNSCSEHQWQDAILQGYAVWRQLQICHTGNVIGDLHRRKIGYKQTCSD